MSRTKKKLFGHKMENKSYQTDNTEYQSAAICGDSETFTYDKNFLLHSWKRIDQNNVTTKLQNRLRRGYDYDSSAIRLLLDCNLTTKGLLNQPTKGAVTAADVCPLLFLK